jgi:hypothetical protein
MRLPKNFYKMSLQEQEVILIKKIQDLHNEEDDIRKMLAKIRGGYQIIEPKEIDRPDELILKT